MKLSPLFVAALSIAAAGCKKKAAAPDCAAAIAHSMDLSKDTMAKQGLDSAAMQKLVDIGITRCKEDKWSAEAVSCMNKALTINDAQACYGKLTKEQQDAMGKATIDAAMAAAKAGSAAGSGSAEGSGSATGSGSADTGSAGSAAAGSGSAAGSATGSGSAGTK
jgi:hypothetical protein